MAKRKTERNKKRRQRQRAREQQTQSPEPAAPQPPPEEAAPYLVVIQPAVDPAVTAKRAELQSSYDEYVERGNAHVAACDLEQAAHFGTRARQAIRESKQLAGVDPIGPGPVRKLKRAIDIRVEVAGREAERQHVSLKARALERLRIIREVAGYHDSLFSKIKLYSGDIQHALELLRTSDQAEIDAMPEEFQGLEADLCDTIERCNKSDAEHRLLKIRGTMHEDVDRALELLRTFPPKLVSYVELDGLEQETEQHRAESERRRQEREASERMSQANELLYHHILGDRSNPVKPRDSMDRLRKAQVEKPLLLELALKRSPYVNIEGLREEIEQRREHARSIWEGFQELEYLEAATSSDGVVKRLLEISERGVLENVLHRPDARERVFRAIANHTDALKRKFTELEASSCVDCWKAACLLLDMLGYGKRTHHDLWWDDGTSVPWYSVYDKLGRMIPEPPESAKPCGGHKPKQAPWQKRTKQSRKRDENAQAR